MLREQRKDVSQLPSFHYKKVTSKSLSYVSEEHWPNNTLDIATIFVKDEARFKEQTKSLNKTTLQTSLPDHDFEIALEQ